MRCYFKVLAPWLGNTFVGNLTENLLNLYEHRNVRHACYSNHLEPLSFIYYYSSNILYTCMNWVLSGSIMEYLYVLCMSRFILTFFQRLTWMKGIMFLNDGVWISLQISHNFYKYFINLFSSSCFQSQKTRTEYSVNPTEKLQKDLNGIATRIRVLEQQLMKAHSEGALYSTTKVS